MNKTESRGQKTVLIVEDQAGMRQILRIFSGTFEEIRAMYGSIKKSNS